jgi:hypothetical protein
MNEKINRLSYKLYLSLQGLVIIVGSIAVIWIFIAGIHDIYISKKGKSCVESTLGAWVIADNTPADSSDWTRAIKKHAESLGNLSKKYELKEQLEGKCSDYLHVSIYEYSGDLSVYTNNYDNGYPATYSERFGYLGIALGLSCFFLFLFYGLMRWISWLSKN